MTKVKFLKAGSGTKRADGTPFYYIDVIMGDEYLRNFVDAGTFKTIVDKKPQLLKDYEARFEQRAMFGKMQSTLLDLNDIK